MILSRRVLISAPRDSVQEYLSDLSRIPDYEPKVDSIQLSPAGEATAAGRFFGMPWRGEFRFELEPCGGYRGVMTRGPLKRMECLLTIRPVNGGTVVEHREEYELPLPLKWLSPLLKRWLNAGIESELSAIKEGAEALNRKLTIQRLEA